MSGRVFEIGYLETPAKPVCLVVHAVDPESVMNVSL